MLGTELNFGYTLEHVNAMRCGSIGGSPACFLLHVAQNAFRENRSSITQPSSRNRMLADRMTRHAPPIRNSIIPGSPDQIFCASMAVRSTVVY